MYNIILSEVVLVASIAVDLFVPKFICKIIILVIIKLLHLQMKIWYKEQLFSGFRSTFDNDIPRHTWTLQNVNNRVIYFNIKLQVSRYLLPRSYFLQSQYNFILLSIY